MDLEKREVERARVRLNSIITIIFVMFLFCRKFSLSPFYDNLLELTIPALIQRFNDYSIWWGSWTLQRALLLIPDVSHQLCVRATREWFSDSLAPSLCVYAVENYTTREFLYPFDQHEWILFCSCLSRKNSNSLDNLQKLFVAHLTGSVDQPMLMRFRSRCDIAL